MIIYVNCKWSYLGPQKFWSTSCMVMQALQEGSWSLAALLGCQTQFAQLETRRRTGQGCLSPSLEPCSQAHPNSSSSSVWIAEAQAQGPETIMATSNPATMILMHSLVPSPPCITQPIIGAPQPLSQAICSLSSRVTPTDIRPTTIRGFSL